MNEAAVHTAFAFAVLVGYVVLTALGHDATNLFLLLAGQGVSLGASKAIPRR